ncbi:MULTISPECIES: helix-turn-helix domain-containing protein [Streptomyces]|uniref:DNA-binding protein n=1 Tax=Streptomyces katrae TaxID=68223 RepID=A0A0F4ISH9_9ACTN|nr:helix-turn-helix transcriptional regulator [Streptomyces katrae]KJY24614.1 DNA-binding protein [Streptomyces katrae]
MAKAANKERAGGATRLVAHLARVLREKAGYTQTELGRKIGYSGAAISAMETCAQPASDEMLVELEREVGWGLGVFEMARGLVRLDKYPAQFQDFIALESRVLTLCMFETLVINGLFQTEAYAQALIAGGYPVLPDRRVAELVEARMERTALFEREPTALIELILDESALLRGVGSPDIMRGQLRHLAELAKRRNVTVQVLPLNCGFTGEHAGARGGLTILETADHEHLAYMEAQDESVMISDPGMVSMYSQRYAKIRAQALGPRESLGLIERLAGDRQ